MRGAFLLEELADRIGENVQFLILPPGSFRHVQRALMHQSVSVDGRPLLAAYVHVSM